MEMLQEVILFSDGPKRSCTQDLIMTDEEIHMVKFMRSIYELVGLTIGAISGTPMVFSVIPSKCRLTSTLVVPELRFRKFVNII